MLSYETHAYSQVYLIFHGYMPFLRSRHSVIPDFMHSFNFFHIFASFLSRQPLVSLTALVSNSFTSCPKNGLYHSNGWKYGSWFNFFKVKKFQNGNNGFYCLREMNYTMFQCMIYPETYKISFWAPKQNRLIVEKILYNCVFVFFRPYL